MRGFLAFVLLLLAGLVVAALVVVPMVVRPMVVDAVRDASPFGEQALDVEVDLNPVGLLLGTIDRVRVTGSDLATEGVEIGALDVTATDVATSSRTFRSLAGRLTGVVLPFVQTEPLTIDTLEVSGRDGGISARALLGVRSSLALVGNGFADAGVAVEDIELTATGVAFVAFGQRLEVALGADDGALVIPDVAGGGPLVLVQPGPDDPWRITGASMTPAGLALDVALDLAKLAPPR